MPAIDDLQQLKRTHEDSMMMPVSHCLLHETYLPPEAYSRIVHEYAAFPNAAISVIVYSHHTASSRFDYIRYIEICDVALYW